jgi:murein DD-endopeptidase MepM/ murein hydrolase activator NlpD
VVARPGGWLHLPFGLLLAAVVGWPAFQSTASGAAPGAPFPAPEAAVADDGQPRSAAVELSGAGGSAAPAPGSAQLAAAESAEPAAPGAAPAGRLIPSLYTVQPGDSLAEIADRFGVDVPTLLGSNDLDDPDLLPLGRALKVLPIRGLLYTVEDGDTLNRVAARYGLAVPDIMRASGIEDSELIRPGDELVLPGARPLYARFPVETATAARVEPPRVELASSVLLPAVPSARPGFLWPSSGPITTWFGEVGWTSPRGHAGLDIAAPWGAPVRAAAAGEVILATRNGGPYGIQVIVDHGNGLRTVYAHLAELHVEAGERVDRGQTIGLVGSTGYSTGPHLHFEVRQHGELRDPMRFLP